MTLYLYSIVFSEGTIIKRNKIEHNIFFCLQKGIKVEITLFIQCKFLQTVIQLQKFGQILCNNLF